MPTGLGRSLVKAHCARNLAVEVEASPLRSAAGSGGPAVPTATEVATDRRRVGKAEVDMGGSGCRGGGGEAGGRGGEGGRGGGEQLW